MSSGYDGKTIIWDIWEGVPIRIYEIGRFKLVDGKFSPDGTSIVLSDDVGQIYLLNTGQGESQKDSKYDQFFLGDYRPLARDAHGNAIDQETQLPPYRRNIQDALCDSSMLPYPEPYQSDYQRRRLGALNLEWRPPSLKFAIGTDIGWGQEYQMLPLADLDVVAEPVPEFLDAMFWEPENDVIVDSTDSEYNVTDECSSEDEHGSLSNSSIDADSSGGNNIVDGSHKDSRRRSKRKKPKDSEWTSLSGRRVKKRNFNEHEGTSSRSKQTKKSRNSHISKKKSDQATPSRPQRASVRNGKKFPPQNEKDDVLSEDDSSESETSVEQEKVRPTTMNAVTPPESRRKLVLKFSIPKKSTASKNTTNQCHNQTNSTPSRVEEEGSKPISGEPSENQDREEASTGTNGLDFRPKPTIIRIKPKIKLNSGIDALTTPTITRAVGECSQRKTEKDDNASQKRKTIKFKFNRHGDGQTVENTLNVKNHDNLTEDDSSEAAADAMRRARSLKFKASSRDTNDARQNHKVCISVGTLRSAEKSTKNSVHLIPFNSNMASASASKSNVQLGKTNWLLLSGQEEGCRYIPQLGDEVVYLRQGHQEYIESHHSSERGPWMLFGETIRDAEICLVDYVDYATLAGSGESCCKVKLTFIDPLSSVSGQTFKLTLPELVNFPDFLVEKTRYDASLERNWRSGEKCSVWWRDEGGGGNWWEGRIVSISDKSVDFPGSQWERFLVKYADDDVDPCRHSPWELHDKDSEWEQPGIDPDIRKMMLSLLSKLDQSARGNQDKLGIMKLKQASERLDFINRFPVPLTLEIIELRIKNFYYRSLEAMNHDIKVMLSNVHTYFAKHAEMSAKMARLSDWFDRKLSKFSHCFYA